MAASFMLNRDTDLHTDVDLDGFADSGDTLRTTVTITNTSTEDATSVVFNDLLGGSTETGLMNISPIAMNDSFTAVGNTVLRVGQAGETAVGAGGNIGSGPSSVVTSLGNLLTNDVGSTTIGPGALAGDDVTGFTCDVVTNGISRDGGTFNVFTDGSFNYVSAAGDTVDDTFTYTIRDAGIDGVAGNADDTTSTGTVTITITDQVWYVDSVNGSDATGTGTSANPYATMSAFSAANVDGANDYIYVQGDVSGQVVLETGEHLIGQGADLDVGGYHLADDGTRSTITNTTNGFAVTLAGGGTGNNEIAGLNIVSTIDATEGGITGTSFGALTVDNVTLNTSGQALNLHTGSIAAGSTGFVSTSSSSSNTNNVNLTSVSGTLDLGTGSLTGTSLGAFAITGGTANVTYAGNITQANNIDMVYIQGHSTGTVTFTGTLNATNGTGIQLDGADGTYNFNGTTTLTGGNAGIDIISGSDGTFNFASGTAITSPTGIGLRVDNSNANVTYSGNITQANNAAAVDVTNHSGGTITFQTGVINANNGSGLQFSNADGTYNFNGTAALQGGDAGIDIDTGSDGAFTFGSNTSLLGTSGTAFTVSGGGGNITFNGVIDDDTGQLVNITSRTGGTIDFNGLVTDKFDGDGGINTTQGSIHLGGNTGGTVRFDGGINLSTAGNDAITAAGNIGSTLVITDPAGPTANRISTTTGTALDVQNTTIGAGGLVFESINQNGGVNAIILSNTGTTAGLSITGTGSANSGGTIQGTSGDGIVLSNTSNVSLTDLLIQNVGGDGINAGGDGIATAGNLGGVNSFTRLSVLNFGLDATDTADGVRLVNSNTNTTLVIDDSVFNGTNDSNDGVFMEAWGTSNMNLRVEDSVFTDIFGDGVEVQSITGSTGTVNVRVWDNDFTNAAVLGNGGVQVDAFGGATFFVDVDQNVFTDIMRPVTNLGAIGMTSGLTAQVDMTIRNNDLDDINGARGITATVDGGHTELMIDNNSIDNLGSTTKFAISVNSTNASSAGTVGNVDVTIQNNDIGQVGNLWSTGNGTAEAIFVTNAFGASIDALIANNVVDANASLEVIRARAAGSGLMNVTMTGNDVTDTNGTRLELAVATGTSGGQPGATVNASISGNILTVGGTITLTEGASGTTPADLNVQQASSAAVSAANSSATVTASAGVDFGQPAPASPSTPTLPSQPLLVATPPAPVVEEPVADQPVVDEPDTDTDTGTGTTDTGTDPDTGTDTGDDQPVVVDDGVLSQAELALIVEAAIDRWEAAGASAEDLAAMRAVTVSVNELGGLYLGASTAGHIVVDTNAAGFNWFVDATPGDDSEYSGTGSVLTAPKDTQAGVRIDLLTTIMHELGHQVGLSDQYGATDRDELMYGTINPGERRLPGSDDLDGASGAPVSGTAFALTAVNLGTIPAGRTVTVQFDSTVLGYTNQLIPAYDNYSTLSGANFPATDSNHETLSVSSGVALDSLTLSNQVFLDVDNDGAYGAGDSGIDDVDLTLFADTNGNNAYDDGTDVQLATATTAGGGLYSFTGLAPGNYIVRVDASNFTAGGELVSRATATGGNDPDDNADNDDNGVAATGGIVVSQAISLAFDDETVDDGTGQMDINDTLDFGFVELNDAPVLVVGGTLNINEDDTNVVLSTTGSAMSVSDAEATGDISYTLFVTSGILTLDTTVVGGVQASDIQPGSANNSQFISILATQTEINTTLAATNALRYTPNADFNGSDTLEVYVNDLGQTGVDPDPTSVLDPAVGPTSEEDYATQTINIAAVDDAPVAQPDAVATDEDDVLTGLAGALFADNGSGIDDDVDGDTLVISHVNGVAGDVGNPVMLTSGALLTVNADGSYTYDPNGEFDTLTDNTSGAVNTAGSDSFKYTLDGGNEVTVTVTVNGVAGPGDWLEGDSGDNTIIGTAQGDLFILSQGGDDTASGLGGDDGFYMGGALGPLDDLDGGGGTNDQLGLQGNYGTFGIGATPYTFSAGNLAGIEALVLLSGQDTRFGDPGTNSYDYHLATIDDNVGAGERLVVDFNRLRLGEDVIFDGSLESDGYFLTFGGNGVDAITGGQQDDGFYFGVGRFGASDTVDGQGGTNDQLGLQGDYTIAFGATQLAGIEMIVLLSAANTTYGGGADSFAYDLKMDDGNVAATETLRVSANTLAAAGETLTFDGALELDGHFVVYGGAGADAITGGALADTLYGAGGADDLTGGGGDDSFAYVSAAHSTAADTDQILDFATGDEIDLSAIDADTVTGGSQAFGWIGSNAFSGAAGELRAFDAGGGVWQVEGDVDGGGTADLVILVTTDHPLTATDFAL